MRFTTTTVAPNRRFDLYFETACRSYVTHEAQPVCKDTFEAEIETTRIDHVCASRVRTSGLHSTRTAEQARSATTDTVFLSFVVAGNVCFAQDEQRLLLKAGDLYLADPRRPFSVSYDNTAQHLVLETSQEQLAARGVELADTPKKVAASRETTVFRNFLSMLVPDQPRSMSGHAADVVVDLAAFALTRGDPDVIKGFSQATSTARVRLHHAIDEGLSESRQSCEEICHNAGITLRYANLLLNQEGSTVERELFLRRVRLAQHKLSDPRALALSIEDVALQSGFKSHAHFSRVFKERVGLTPREWRRTHSSS